VSCCTSTGYRTIFGTKTVERDARRYRRKGLIGSAGWLLTALTEEGVSERSVLEVGGGIGSLQIELLEAGARHATNVEIIDSYESAARSLITEHRLEDRVDRHVSDYAQHSDQAPAADIVILHRVICCYPDADTLTAAACSRARDRVAITIPREAPWVRSSRSRPRMAFMPAATIAARSGRASSCSTHHPPGKGRRMSDLLAGSISCAWKWLGRGRAAVDAWIAGREVDHAAAQLTSRTSAARTASCASGLHNDASSVTRSAP
jgi:hypothetical protein